MFKKSTIILIAVSVAFWVALISVVAYVASTGVPYSEKTIELSDDSPSVTKEITKFSKLDIYSSTIVFSKAAKIRIVQCDTISAPKLIVSEAVDTFLTYSVDSDTLNISFKCSQYENERYNIWFKGSSPLTILTPTCPEDIKISGSYNPMPIALNNIKTSKVNIIKNGNIELTNCSIDSLMLNFTRYYDGYTVKANDSKIGHLNPDFLSERSGELYLLSDSAATSTIRHLEWSNQSDRKHELTLDNITVNNLNYGSGAITLYLKNNATAGTISTK